MSQIIAEIIAVKSIFLYVDMLMQLYIFFNNANRPYKFSLKFAEKYREMCKFKMAGMCRKVRKFSSKTIITS